ncbi:MAG: YicC family protein [Lachnospiraceae bacterium]|nr:YicC family protein [Lachnospiraceae bacterium]
MIRSMTGFGHGEVETGDRRMVIEIKTINHRYLDVNIKMPKRLAMYDGKIRNILKDYMERGKVDIFVTFEDNSINAGRIYYNEALAGEYYKYLKQMSETFGLDLDIRTSTLSKYPEVLEFKENDSDDSELYELLEKALKAALEDLVKERETEGEKLKTDLLSKLDDLDGYVAKIEARAPDILKEYKDRLFLKVQDFIADNKLDEGRIAAEVTMYADKICVDEEIVRLKSHISGMRDILKKGGAIGRKLDFIAQEMNREANTTLSKSTDIEITDVGINLKTDIEKIREQVQNIE